LRIALYGELLYEGARTDFSLIYHPIDSYREGGR
jgi:hypothetical protein